MLPMGTIVTVCMFAGIILAADLPISRHLPKWLSQSIATLVLLAGLWNILWYALQHLTEFWGLAALVSGALMIIISLYVLAPDKLPRLLKKSKPILLVILTGYALMYAVTIARL